MGTPSALVGALTLVVLVATPASAAAQGGQKYDTPQAVFDAFNKAQNWKTACGCLTTDSLDQLVGTMAFTVPMMAFMGSLGKDKKVDLAAIKRLDDVNQKHGVKARLDELLGPLPLDKDPAQARAKALRSFMTLGQKLNKLVGPRPQEDDPAAQQEWMKRGMRKLGGLLRVKDSGAYLDDLTDTLKTLDPRERGFRSSQFLGAEARLVDLRIDGDTANAIVISKTGGQERRRPLTFQKTGGGWRIELAP
jgi:hypothetical protein